MGTKRNLAIGITVNLDNYENLRLEVSGEVAGEEDAEELVRFLDSMLSRFGRGSTETAERIESYRRRVILPPEAAPSGARAITAEKGDAETAAPALDVAPAATAMGGAEEVLRSEQVTAQPQTTAESAVAARKDDGAKVAEPEFRCERCGAPITAVQRKLSRLFQDRDLCKNCLTRP